MSTSEPRHGPERDDELRELKREVAAIQVGLLSATTPWYRQASTLIALLALLFSFGTTFVSCSRDAAQDRHNWRRELRALIIQIVEMPLRNMELYEKFRSQPFAAGNISSMMNHETSILADQAKLVMRQIPDMVTANEYLTVAYAFSNAGLLQSAREMRQRALAVAATPIEAAMTLRQTGAMAFQQRDFASGRAAYEEALNVFDQPRFAADKDAGVTAFTNAVTQMYWAQAEATASECGRFREHIQTARRLMDDVPAGSRGEILPQIDATERYGCPPAAPPPPAPGQTMPDAAVPDARPMPVVPQVPEPIASP